MKHIQNYNQKKPSVIITGSLAILNGLDGVNSQLIKYERNFMKLRYLYLVKCVLVKCYVQKERNVDKVSPLFKINVNNYLEILCSTLPSYYTLVYRTTE